MAGVRLDRRLQKVNVPFTSKEHTHEDYESVKRAAPIKPSSALQDEDQQRGEITDRSELN